MAPRACPRGDGRRRRGRPSLRVWQARASCGMPRGRARWSCLGVLASLEAAPDGRASRRHGEGAKRREGGLERQGDWPSELGPHPVCWRRESGGETLWDVCIAARSVVAVPPRPSCARPRTGPSSICELVPKLSGRAGEERAVAGGRRRGAVGSTAEVRHNLFGGERALTAVLQCVGCASPAGGVFACRLRPRSSGQASVHARSSRAPPCTDVSAHVCLGASLAMGRIAPGSGHARRKHSRPTCCFRQLRASGRPHRPFVRGSP